MSGSKVSQQDIELYLVVSDININILVLILWLILLKVQPSYTVCQLCILQELQFIYRF